MQPAVFDPCQFLMAFREFALVKDGAWRLAKILDAGFATQGGCKKSVSVDCADARGFSGKKAGS